MAEATPSTAVDSAAQSAPILVQFSSETGEAHFSDAMRSDWAVAAHHGTTEGEALDTLVSEEPTLPPLMAISAFVLAEAEMYDGADNPLVVFAATAAGDDQGHIMWSGEDLAEANEPPASEPRGEPMIVLHDFVSHGVSLDWTDPLYS